jgi:hypothetical protein
VAGGPLGNPIVRIVALVLIVLLGIVCGEMYDRLKQSPTGASVDILAVARQVCAGARFWMALFISPFLFFATYSAVGSDVGLPTAFILAFQNGFFWNTVFGGFQKGGTGTSTA